MNVLRLGIIGSGWIAEKMAITLQGLPSVEAYAISSRDESKARQFAQKWGFTCAYGSYESMLDDPSVDLVYVATPHSHHYEHAKMCLLKGKPVLCEKAFTATAAQAEELLALAKSKGVFITEAIWTRYQPMRQMIDDVVNSGIIGKPLMLNANLGYPLSTKPRMQRPDLAGGALLDLGVYAINFARMVFGTDIRTISSCATLTASGMDEQESITFVYEDGRVAVLSSSMCVKMSRRGVISGEKGYIEIQNINNPERISVYNEDYQLIKTVDCPPQITGYEYQVLACKEALEKGWLESPCMPHAETLAIMKLMDGLRAEWGVRYPWD